MKIADITPKYKFQFRVGSTMTRVTTQAPADASQVQSTPQYSWNENITSF